MNNIKCTHKKVDEWLQSIGCDDYHQYEIINDRLNIKKALRIGENDLPPFALGITHNIYYSGMSLGSTDELPLECDYLCFRNVATMHHMDFRNSILNRTLDIMQCNSITHATNINFNSCKNKHIIRMSITECDNLKTISFLNKTHYCDRITIAACKAITSFECLSLCEFVEHLRLSACSIFEFPNQKYFTTFTNVSLDCEMLQSFQNIQNVNITGELYVQRINNTRGIINLIFTTAPTVKTSIANAMSYSSNALLTNILHKYISEITPCQRSDYVMDLCVALIDNCFELEAEL